MITQNTSPLYECIHPQNNLISTEQLHINLNNWLENDGLTFDLTAIPPFTDYENTEIDSWLVCLKKICNEPGMTNYKISQLVCKILQSATESGVFKGLLFQHIQVADNNPEEFGPDFNSLFYDWEVGCFEHDKTLSEKLKSLAFEVSDLFFEHLPELPRFIELAETDLSYTTTRRQILERREVKTQKILISSIDENDEKGFDTTQACELSLSVKAELKRLAKQWYQSHVQEL